MLRAINLELFEDPAQEYIWVDPQLDNREQVGHRIKSFPDEPIADVLAWMGAVREDQFEWAWSKFMAGLIAQQLWPDGNHRTSFLLLEEIARATFGETISLSQENMDRMREGSKAILQKFPVLPGSPVFALPDLDHPDHPYRIHFAKFASKLVWSTI